MTQKQRLYKNTALSLKDVTPFAEGGNRFCFVHPEDSNLCVKVTKPGSVAAMRAKRSFIRNLRSDRCFDDNLNEYKAYQQSAITSGGPRIYDHLPRCYGWQDTDIGMGLVSDYYMQEDGAPCITLEHYLHTKGLTDEIERQLNALGDYLRDTQLMTKNIIPHNVVCATDGKLKIIDGIGFPSAINIAHINKTAKKRYIERRIARMFLRAKWEVSDKSKTWKSVEKSGAL